MAGLAALASGSLVLLTTLLHEASSGLVAAVESVRIAEHLEINLLLHQRTHDPILRAELEGDIRQQLVEIHAYVTSAEELQILSRADETVERYLTAPATPARELMDPSSQLTTAYMAIEKLVDVNLDQAKALQRWVAQWDRIGNIVGIGVSLLIPLTVGLLAWWLQSQAFRPVLALSDVMSRFGQGDKSARAEQTGVAELHEIAMRFNEMASALARQREAQLTFLAGVAHDLRNPLGALRMSTELFSAEKPLPPEPRAREIMALVRRQILRLERMVSDFLDTAQIEAGKLDLQCHEWDARDLAREIVSLFEATSPIHRIELSIPDDRVPLWCDPLRLEQVITNLISNAIKYSPKGGRVCVSVAERGDRVILAVSDEGVGMTEEEARSLFEPFRRGRRSREDVPGAGLGLSIVRRILDAHGGRIEVRSRPGEGSAFEVSLPSSKAERPAGPR